MQQEAGDLPGHSGAKPDKHPDGALATVQTLGQGRTGMAQRIYIKVVGFSDEERHALNTVFRLSEQCRTMYQLWTTTAAEPARAALLDGQSWEARVEAESPLHRELRLLWVGANPPASIWRAFPRPIQWPDVIEGLDALFSPNESVDLALGETPESAMSSKHALIVSADRQERLYLRARLALARLTHADEAETGNHAVELARGRKYDLALVDSSLDDMDAWALLRSLKGGRNPVRHIALTKAARSVSERVRAWVGGAALLENPPDAQRLDAWLSRIELGPAG
jgi:CheY-like chemotaxis protein